MTSASATTVAREASRWRPGITLTSEKGRSTWKGCGARRNAASPRSPPRDLSHELLTHFFSHLFDVSPSHHLARTEIRRVTRRSAAQWREDPLQLFSAPDRRPIRQPRQPRQAPVPNLSSNHRMGSQETTNTSTAIQNASSGIRYHLARYQFDAWRWPTGGQPVCSVCCCQVSVRRLVTSFTREPKVFRRDGQQNLDGGEESPPALFLADTQRRQRRATSPMGDQPSASAVRPAAGPPLCRN